MTTFVALLRGINVGGKNKVPRATLRGLAEQLGASNPRTHVQSGNLVVEARGSAAELEEALEAALVEHLDVKAPVIVRSARQWTALIDEKPAPDANPQRLMLALAKYLIARGAAAHLEDRAAARESMVRSGDAFWIHFPNGVARSKLTPAVLDHAAGSPVTMRNLRTVEAIRSLVQR